MMLNVNLQEPGEKRLAMARTTTAVIAVIIVILAAGGIYAYYATLPSSSTTSSSTTSSTSSTSCNLAAGQPFKIGMTVSETGASSQTGVLTFDGVQTAIAYVNQNGGVVINGVRHNMTLVYYDDASDPSNVVPLYTKLILQDHVCALIGPYNDAMESAAAPLSAQYNIPIFASGAAAPTLFSQGYTNFIGATSDLPLYYTGVLSWLALNQPNAKIAFLYINNLVGESFYSGVLQNLATNSSYSGLNIVYAQSYPGTTTDFTPLLSAAKASGATVLLTGSLVADGQLIGKGLAAAGWTPSFVSIGVAPSNPNWPTVVGQGANLVTFPADWLPTTPFTPADAAARGLTFFGMTSSQYTSMFESMFPSAGTPEYHSAQYAESVFLIQWAVQSTNSVDTTTLVSFLHTHQVETFFGPWGIDGSNVDYLHPMLIAQWINGGVQTVWPSSVATTQLVYPYTGK